MPSIAIQHHPSRAHLLSALRARLGDSEVVRDPDPDGPRSALRTYRLALARTPRDARHRIVIQDDAWPVSEFRALAEDAIREKPDSLIAFFVPGTGQQRQAMNRAAALGHRWTELPRADWAPTVALSWPRELAFDFLDWSEEAFPFCEGDDGPVGAYVRKRKLTVWATVPSIVEHPNTEPSLFGKPSRGAANRGRVAALAHESLSPQRAPHAA